MKILTTSIFLFLTCSLFAQTSKGASPLPSPVDTPSSSETYAVVIGISDYQNEGIPDLRFADKDALAFAGFLQSPAGGSLDEDHIKVLVNKQATAGQVGAELFWLLDEVKEGDNAIIYFSGHGDVERKTIIQPGYLLCWDAPSKVYLSGGALALPMFQDVITTLSAQNKAKVIVITDACRSGKLSGSSVGGSQITGSNLAKQYNNEVKILSCQPDEYSVEGEQWGGGRGAFSYHLLDGLYGLADKNGDQVVNLLEIGRYLEDHVSSEVAPESQIPMTIGNRSESLTEVVPEVLTQIKEDKKRQMSVITSTETRGIEDEVLAAADTNIVEMYDAFKESINNKKFLKPENACADFYYNKLSQEQQLKKLHASMRRNYAAALQDDAQQVMNRWLSYYSKEMALSRVNQIDKYQLYPTYLERAAELLGENHYMYPILKARSLFFEAYLMHVWNFFPNKALGKIILSKYREALQLQPDAPHVYFRMMGVHFSQMQEPDSAEYYAHRATELIPGWFLPYSYLGWLYRETDPERARHFLELAERIDSTAIESSLFHHSHWANFYSSNGYYQEALVTWRKIMQIDSTNSRVYQQIGVILLELGRPKEAEQNFEKAMRLDPTNAFARIDAGWMYCDQNRFDEAEQIFKRAMQIDPTEIIAYNGLGWAYMNLYRFDEAEKIFKEGIRLDSTNAYTYHSLGMLYRSQNRFAEADQCFKKAIQLNSPYIQNYNSLGSKYMRQKRFKEAEKMYSKTLSLHDQNESALYNMACLNSLQKNNNEAFNWLKKILELKIIPYEKYQSDSDFDNIRDTKAFKRLMKKYFPDQHKN